MAFPSTDTRLRKQNRFINNSRSTFLRTIKEKKGKIHTAEIPMVRAIIANKFGPALSSFPHRHNPSYFCSRIFHGESPRFRVVVCTNDFHAINNFHKSFYNFYYYSLHSSRRGRTRVRPRFEPHQRSLARNDIVKLPLAWQ